MNQIFIFRFWRLILAVTAVFLLLGFITLISILGKCKEGKKSVNTAKLFKKIILSLFIFCLIFFGIQGFYVWRISTCNE